MADGWWYKPEPLLYSLLIRIFLGRKRRSGLLLAAVSLGQSAERKADGEHRVNFVKQLP